MKRIIIFGALAVALWTAEVIWLTTLQPEISAALALGQANGGADAAKRLREFETFKNVSIEAVTIVTLFAAWLCFEPAIRKNLGLVMRKTVRYARA